MNNIPVYIDKINPFLFQRILKDIDSLELESVINHKERTKDNLVNYQRSIVSDIPFLEMSKDVEKEFKQEIFKFVNLLEDEHDTFSTEYNFTTDINLDNAVYDFESLWINVQRPGDFVPLHSHTGMYSFVLWVKVPYELSRESIVRKSDHRAGTFNFVYTDCLGNLTTHTVHADKSYEGYLAVFPAKLHHLVYPFYDMSDLRITISGNLNIQSKNG